MPHDSLRSDEWFRALTLAERAANLHARGAAPCADLDAAARRLQRWKTQPPFPNQALFDRRLAADHVSEPDLLSLLGEPVSAVRERCASDPAWLAELASAYADAASAYDALPQVFGGRELASFFDLVAPLLARASDRLRGRVAELARSSPLRFEPSGVVDVCAAQLPQTLMMMLSRTLVLELNVARMEGQLDGESPRERFEGFVRRLRQLDTALPLLEEYPVLARQVVSCLDRWVETNVELLQRLARDWESMRDALAAPADPGPLVELAASGDSHRGGRRVVIAAFSSGFRVVYKPKPLAVDRHFQELLGWLNERGASPPLRTLRMLDRESYGWVEYVTPGPCASMDEVRRFYERLGAYLALFYALEATDFHAENLLAAGEHPMPIDLEALFHPRPVGTVRDDADPALSALEHSVVRVGLLPERSWATDDSVGVDMSGMGRSEGQLTPFGVPQWEDQATDTMQLVRKRIAMPGTHNQPTLDGAAVDLVEHTAAVEAGFRHMYELLLSHRDELLGEGGPIAAFGDDEVRVILRPTQTYGALLRESFHPDVLRNALDRDRFLDRLWADVDAAPHLARVTPFERADLLAGDVPMFTTRPRSRDLWTSGGEVLADFFSDPGLALATAQLRKLSDGDLERQLWIVRASLATVATGTRPMQRTAVAATPEGGAIDAAQLIERARAVGDRLDALALRRGGGAAWLGLTLLDDQHWAVAPLGVDLYDGLPGVALFLAQLGDVTGEDRYASLARAAVTTLRPQLELMKPRFAAVGGFCGWGGVVYALTHLSALWRDAALLDEAEALVDLVPPLVASDDQLDVIGGAAGAIAALLALHHQRPSPRALAAAIACGERLVARAEPQPAGGVAVRTAGTALPLTGFSHGAAGMAWALLDLAVAARDERFRATALGLVEYERTQFSAQAENWPDLRDWVVEAQAGGPPACQTLWCHGAPGVGLARLGALRHVDDRAVRREIDAALETTAREGFGYNHSLCHGDLGNLELLLEASRLPAWRHWESELGRVARQIAASLDQHGWKCGNPLNVESPGLMTGLAGIGYGLLRLADPDGIPSVLTLEPPRRR